MFPTKPRPILTLNKIQIPGILICTNMAILAEEQNHNKQKQKHFQALPWAWMLQVIS